MFDVHMEDLRDTGRLLRLFDNAVSSGMISSSQETLHNFVAAAEHAIRVGRTPVALFVATVKEMRREPQQRKLLDYITDGDDEAARRRLVQYRAGPTPPRPDPRTLPRSCSARDKHLSPDARLVRVARSCLAGRSDGEVYAHMRQGDRSWTEVRFRAAVVQLDAANAKRESP